MYAPHLLKALQPACDGGTLPGVARPGRATENLGGVNADLLAIADGVETLLCSLEISHCMRDGLNLSRRNCVSDLLVCLKDGVRTSAASRREATASRRVMTASMKTEGRQPRSMFSCCKQSESLPYIFACRAATTKSTASLACLSAYSSAHQLLQLYKVGMVGGYVH